MSDQIGGVSAFKQKFVEAKNKLIAAGNTKPTTKDIIAAIKTAQPHEHVIDEGISGFQIEHNPEERPPYSEYEEILDEQETIQQVFEKSILKDMKSPDDFAKLDLSKYTLIADAGPNKDIRMNPDTKEMISKEVSDDGKTVTITYESYGIKHTIKFIDGKFSEGIAGVRRANDTLQEYEYAMNEEGTVTPKSMIQNPDETTT